MEPVIDARVFVVDDDASVREALAWLLRSRRLHSEAFESAPAFQQQIESAAGAPPEQADRPARSEAFEALFADSADRPRRAAVAAATSAASAAATPGASALTSLSWCAKKHTRRPHPAPSVHSCVR